MPDNAHFPSFDSDWLLRLTPAIQTPGPTIREAVLIEWTDTEHGQHNIRRHRPRTAARPLNGYAVIRWAT